MSEEIPKAPILMRTYNLLRSKLTPTQNIVYVLFEHLILGLGASAFLYYYLSSTLIVSGIPILLGVLTWVARLVSIQPDKKMKEQYVMRVRFKSFLVLCILVAVPLGVYYYLRGYADEIPIIGGLFLVYLATTYGRSRKYLGEREYFTDDYSDASQEWYMASVALEQAVSHAERENSYRAYYWASRAQSLYEKVVEKEERTTLREAASALSAGCEFLSVSVFTDGSESYSYYSAAQQSFERAAESLSQRVCDNCGRRRRLDNCQRLVRDGQKYIYCNTCKEQAKRKRERSSNEKEQTGRKRKSTTSQSSSRNRRQKSSTSSSQSYKSSSSSSRNSGQNQSSRNKSNDSSKADDKKDEQLSKKEALEVLGLEEPIDEPSEIHAAFRRNVKNAHPDTGGSEEEFKKVKRAREVLLDTL